MPIQPSGINATSMNDPALPIGISGCPPTSLIVLGKPSSSNAPQNLQNEAVRGFLFLQIGQNLPEGFKSISPE
jgi:hypothetical protein